MHHTHRTHTARTPHAHRTHISRTSHAVVSLQVVDFSALICFVGLAYLDTKAPNLLVAYTLLTVATLPLDAVTLCMLGHPASFLQWARSTAYFFILIFKCCSLVLMGMLHTKARHTPPSHPPPPNNSSRAARIPHTYRRVRMRRTAAASAHTTRPPPPAQLLAIPSTRPPFSPPCAVWCRSSLRSGYGQSRRKNSSETPTSPQRGASTVREVGPRASNDQELQWPQRTFCGPSTASVLIKRIK